MNASSLLAEHVYKCADCVFLALGATKQCKAQHNANAIRVHVQKRAWQSVHLPNSQCSVESVARAIRAPTVL